MQSAQLMLQVMSLLRWAKSVTAEAQRKRERLKHTTKRSSDREMKTMFGRSDSESESEPSKRLSLIHISEPTRPEPI
eukprot:1037988-Pyramimonas_sp.AAC.1